jgi:glycosyltransferase involved in cell wall biosynthesis
MRALEIAPETAAGYRVVAVIPAFNEERFIASVVITALQYAQHVIVVDDGSADRTAHIARIAGAEVIELPENQGKGRALNAGLDRARELNPMAVVMLDGDAQHDPAEIPELVRPIAEGEADVVIGSRFLDRKSEIPAWRRVGQHALTYATNSTSGVAMTDSQSGFRALSVTALRKLRFNSSGLAAESEMQFLLRDSQLRTTEVSIGVQYRDGNKRNPVVHGLQVLDAILSLVARRRPLMFLGAPGITLMTLGLIVGLHVVQVVNGHHPVPLGTAVLSALFVLIGLMLGITAIILNTLEHFMRRLRGELQALTRLQSAERLEG